MTPEQRLGFCKLLKEARANNVNITVDQVVDVIGISKEEASQSWHSEFRVLLAFENNYKWIVHAKECDED